MEFDFYTAGRILFGSGSLGRIAEVAPQFGRNFLIVSGGKAMENTGVLGRIERQLVDDGLSFHYYKGITQEPEPDTIEKGTAIAREFRCDAVIAIGGGSVIDTGKAIAAMITNEGEVLDYLEGVGKGRRLLKDPAPCIAIPTTAGTGSEVTKNAVITSLSMRFKKSLRHERMIPAVALVDPLLTLSLPQTQTAYSGMDALAQLIEAYVSRKANPLTDVLALHGIGLVSESLKTVYQDGSNLKARENMAYASLLSGICLANAGLGAVHGIAAALGCFYGVPHGLACAVMLPHVMALNTQADGSERYARIGMALTGRSDVPPQEAIEQGIAYVKELNHAMNIPCDLKPFGVEEADLLLLAEASRGNSMSGNPVTLSDQDIIVLLKGLL